MCVISFGFLFLADVFYFHFSPILVAAAPPWLSAAKEEEFIVVGHCLKGLKFHETLKLLKMLAPCQSFAYLHAANRCLKCGCMSVRLSVSLSGPSKFDFGSFFVGAALCQCFFSYLVCVRPSVPLVTMCS